ncbi:hypothetical protein F2Q70_00039562, partial [Brassica cretica]
MEVAAATATSFTTLRARTSAIIPSPYKVRCSSSSSLRASLSRMAYSPHIPEETSLATSVAPSFVYTVRIFEFEVFVAVADLLCCRDRCLMMLFKKKLCDMRLPSEKEVQYLVEVSLTLFCLTYRSLIAICVDLFYVWLYLFSKGSAHEQPPPDLALYLFKNRIVYLGMSLVPIYLYINSTGTTNLGYDTEAFAIYDVMGYVKPPIFTLCVRNAWREAALLLTAGAKGNSRGKLQLAAPHPLEKLVIVSGLQLPPSYSVVDVDSYSGDAVGPQRFHRLAFTRRGRNAGSAHEQPPPDLALYLFKNRIVYLGMSLVPSVTELILFRVSLPSCLREFYFAIYDVMGYVKPPIFTLCVRNAWREADLLLTAGAKGNSRGKLQLAAPHPLEKLVIVSGLQLPPSYSVVDVDSYSGDAVGPQRFHRLAFIRRGRNA